MKTPAWLMLTVLVGGGFATAQAAPPEEMVENIQWLGKQASVRIAVGETVVYIDPYDIDTEYHDANLVLMTHDHADHCSPADVKKVATEKTLLAGIPACLDKLTAWQGDSIQVTPGGSLERAGVKVEAVPAYNVKKTQFHPKRAKHVGYLITMDGVRIYHAGDTELIPEMKDLACDIALVPLGQTYTMNSVEDAAQAVLETGAKIAIPMHYGLYEGTDKDAQRFQKLLDGKVQVVIQR